jgi:hypothetical protein
MKGHGVELQRSSISLSDSEEKENIFMHELHELAL